MALLRKLPCEFPDVGTIHLVCDNYTIHKSKKTLAAMAELNWKIKLHFLPPYSPQHNPIERVWWE